MKTWILQKGSYKYETPFWDSYLHDKCKTIRISTKNPFKKVKDNEKRRNTTKSHRTD